MTVLRDTSFARLLKAEFPDVEALCAAVRSWDLDFRPLVPPVGLDSVGRITQQRCGSVEIGYARFKASSIDNERFEAEVEQLLGVKVGQARRGRPNKKEIRVGQKR